MEVFVETCTASLPATVGAPQLSRAVPATNPPDDPLLPTIKVSPRVTCVVLWKLICV